MPRKLSVRLWHALFSETTVPPHMRWIILWNLGGLPYPGQRVHCFSRYIALWHIKWLVIFNADFNFSKRGNAGSERAYYLKDLFSQITFPKNLKKYSGSCTYYLGLQINWQSHPEQSQLFRCCHTFYGGAYINSKRADLVACVELKFSWNMGEVMTTQEF